MNYIAADLKTIDALDYIRSHPEMFTPSGFPSPAISALWQPTRCGPHAKPLDVCLGRVLRAPSEVDEGTQQAFVA